MQFGLIYFSSGEPADTPSRERGPEKYRLVLEGARFADRAGFSAVWLPERHFNQAGCLFPNPSVLHAALARETERVALRAGSVVAPLHSPLRIAEEWAVVDNLSGGRVGLALASGWHPVDFAFAPENYAERHRITEETVETLRSLWRGETIPVTGGDGSVHEVRTFPTPIQAELPLWLTAAGNPKTFELAGRLGLNLLTHVFNLGIDQLAESIALYRRARAEAGFDPQAGCVSLMLHTFVASDHEAALATMRPALCEYLRDAGDLLAGIARSRGQQIDLSRMSPRDIEEYVEFVFHRLVDSQRVLVGSPERCREFLVRLAAAGVDEIACQLDFGIDTQVVIDSFPALAELNELCRGPEFEASVKQVRGESMENVQATAAIPSASSSFERLRDHLEPITVSSAEVVGRLAREGSAILLKLEPPKDAKPRSAGRWIALALRAAELLAEREGLAVRRIGRLRVPRGGGECRYLQLELLPGSGDSDLAFECRLLDSAGQVVGAISEFVLEARQQAPTEGCEEIGAALQGCFYETVWEKVESPDEASPFQGSDWLILAEGAGVAEALAEQLQAAGAACRLLPNGEIPKTLASLEYSTNGNGHAVGGNGSAKHSPRRILDLRSLNVSIDAAAPPSSAPCAAALETLQFAASAGMETWLITRNAVGVKQGEYSAPSQAAVWGLARAAAVEQPENWGGLVDIANGAGSTEAAAAIFAGLRAALGAGEDQIAVRPAGCFAPRLARIESTFPPVESPKLRADGAYLITGGLGGLGLHTARRFAALGAGSLLLTGRTPLTAYDPRRTALEELESHGCSVRYFTAAAEDREALAGILAEHRAAGGAPLRGIVHAAGVWRDTPLAALSPEALEEVLAPKLLGGCNLARVAAEESLDFFVLFSSAASQLAMPGQANYSAANAALDALATELRARGVPAIAVQWGPIAEIGFGAAPEGEAAHKRLAALGIDRLTSAEFLAVLEGALAPDRNTLGVWRIDWPRLAEMFPAIRRSPLLRRLVPSTDSGATRTNGRASTPLQRELLALDRPAREVRLRRLLRDRLATALRLPPERVAEDRPLNRMGLDSILAVEVKNRLETELGASPSITSLLQGPSLGELADLLLERLEDLPASRFEKVQSERPARLPLSYVQRALWFLHQLAPESAAYNILFPARIQGRLDSRAVERSFAELQRRHAILRTVYPDEGGLPWQEIREEQAEVDWIAAEGWSEQTLRERLLADSHAPFELARGPVVRLNVYRQSETEHTLLLVVHHIAIDFWSLVLLFEEFRALYAHYSSGANGHGPPMQLPPTDYAEFALRQIAMLAGDEGDRLWMYWKEQLAAPLPLLDLPTDRPRPPLQTFSGGAVNFTLDSGLTAALRKLAAEHGTTLYTVLLAAWQVMLHRLTGQEDLIVGSPATGRQHAELESVVGCFINPLVMRTDLGGQPTFSQLLERTRDTVLGALAHQDFPTALLVERLELPRDPSRSPLFETVFVLNQPPQRHAGLAAFLQGEEQVGFDLAGLPMQTVELPQQSAMFDLLLMMVELGGRLSASLQFNGELFDTGTIERWAEWFRRLLEDVSANPEQPIGAIRLAGADEIAEVTRHWSLGPPLETSEESILEVFAEQFTARADARAVTWFEGPRENIARHWSYAELELETERMAAGLLRRGIRRGDRVALCLPRIGPAVAALLAIWRCGAIAVPLDPLHGEARIARILEAAEPKLLITSENLASFANAPELDFVLHSELGEETSEKTWNPPAGSHPAYLIFTSGTTGRPKGILVEHRSLAAAFGGWRVEYRLAELESHLSLASMAFDVFLADLVRALGSGGRLVMAPEEVRLSPERLAALLAEERIDCVEMTPVVLRGLLEHLEERGQRLDKARLVAVGSDTWYLSEFDRLRAVCGPHTRVINSYGLTETTIDNTWLEHSGAEDSTGGHDRPVPLGKPFPGAEVFVLDRNLRPAPIGVRGELYIGGTGVARGYMGDAPATAARFVPHPFASRAGARLVKTGDAARWQADGTLELLGRLDFQVKIRGYRVELAEIEAALLAHPAIEEAVVLARNDLGEQPRLAAYLVAGEEPPAMDQLRRFLTRTLPEYMLPAYFTFLAAMPVSETGKVDRRALPVPELSRPEMAAPYAPAETPLEEELVALWQEVLGMEGVGVEDNFFDLGGHSLLATQVVARVRDRFQVELPLRDLFFEPTIRRLAVAIEQCRENEEALPLPPVERSAVVDSRNAADLLSRLDELSDEEVATLLASLEADGEG